MQIKPMWVIIIYVEQGKINWYHQLTLSPPLKPTPMLLKFTHLQRKNAMSMVYILRIKGNQKVFFHAQMYIFITA